METIEIELPEFIITRLQEYANRIGMEDYKELASLWLAMMVMQKTFPAGSGTKENCNVDETL